MGRLDLPDVRRDEDEHWVDLPHANFRRTKPEIGSDAWIAAEIAAGRSGEEIDKLGRGRAPAAVLQGRESGRTRSGKRAGRLGCDGASAPMYAGVTGRVRASALPALLVWLLFFVLLALGVHA